ncbi:hypothetical protein [uncultured Salipiger sp.]|uniref:hypothetical protein n=1 Tax=uncultured Salipiger sp. TaxID=499810 RepID=UPI0025922477|nr:hypothetical protein [uncultured Salipiger sp.]
MAVVTTNSDLIHDFTDPDSVPPDPQRARGRIVVAIGTVANLSTDSSASMYHLADIPAEAILLPDTFFDVENWGFAQVVIGTRTDTDALVDQTKATETVVTPIAVGDANHGLALWEVLGLAEKPKDGVCQIWAHAEAAATGAGSMPFGIHYLMP